MKANGLSVVALALALAALAWQAAGKSRSAKIAFVETARLLTSFSEAHKVNEELKVEDEKWRKNAKTLEDSLKVFMDSMTATYDKAPMESRRKMQDELAVKNQQVNTFTAVSTRKMQELTQQRMAGVYEKINAFMKEYGKDKGYDIVFGSANGSIIYGEGTSLDITNDVIEKLNKRYP